MLAKIRVEMAGIVRSIVSAEQSYFYSPFLQNIVQNCNMARKTVFNVTDVDCHEEALDI